MAAEIELNKELGKRLAVVRRLLLEQTRSALAEAYGIPERTLEKYEQGVTKVPLELLLWLHLNYSVNLNWLIAGSGDSYNLASSDLNSDEAYVVSLFRELPSSAHGSAIAMLEHIKFLAAQ